MIGRARSCFFIRLEEGQDLLRSLVGDLEALLAPTQAAGKPASRVAVVVYSSWYRLKGSSWHRVCKSSDAPSQRLYAHAGESVG